MAVEGSLVSRLRRLILIAMLAAVAGTWACAPKDSNRRSAPPGTARPDQFLLDKGTAALTEKKWATAREFFKLVNETYTQSPLRQDAKIGVGDTYLGENSPESLVLAIAEFQEFLSFYPTHARADYAQYKLGLAHFRQMRSPQRDQSETREAIRDFETFITRHPNSALMPEVTARLREAKDRSDDADYLVAVFYFRQQWYPGAIDRLKVLLRDDPEFARRDGAYYYLGESLARVNRKAEALPHFERLLAEFEKSEFLVQTRKRVDEIKAAPPQDAGATPPKDPAQN